MAELEYFLDKIRELKNEDSKGNLSGKEYLTKLDQIIYTYCPGGAYYKNNKYDTMMLINNNSMEHVEIILKRELELHRWINKSNHH